MKKLVLVLLAGTLSAIHLQAAPGVPSWGGRYVQNHFDEDGALLATAQLLLIPQGPDATVFNLTITQRDGYVIYYDTDNQPIPVKDGLITYYFPDEEIDYCINVDLNPVPGEDTPDAPFVRVDYRLNSEYPPYSGDVQPEGCYLLDQNYFPDANGYLYYMEEADESCILARGGIYEGAITLPERVTNRKGKPVFVRGIASDAFMDSRMVNQVVLSHPDQRVEPGAYTFTTIPYNWDKLKKPRFAYPDESLRRFVIPMYADESYQAPAKGWVVFKQNVIPALQSRDTHLTEGLCGRADYDFDGNQGVFYDLQGKASESARNFRGYSSYEIEALVTDQDFVAFHTFPAFGRWKFPEAEKSASPALESEAARLFGRPVMYSRRAAWLRDGNGELDIVEFEHQGGEAMVAFIWSSRGEIYASGTLTAQIPEGDAEFSVWNVDDEGRYGIPDVVTIAFDPDGYANIFLAKNSPESVTCLILHQVGEQFEIIEADQWYRYIP